MTSRLGQSRQLKPLATEFVSLFIAVAIALFAVLAVMFAYTAFANNDSDADKGASGLIASQLASNATDASGNTVSGADLQFTQASSSATDAPGAGNSTDLNFQLLEPSLVPASFIQLLLEPGQDTLAIAQMLLSVWDDSMVPMALETLHFSYDPEVNETLVALLKLGTGQDFGDDTDAWYQWWWRQPEIKHSHYSQFKASLYRIMDGKFVRYFEPQRRADIRLDEVRWGGVRQDGIPPLRQPKMINAADADYLGDDDVIFALEYNGDARAYPKRILAWHEMFIDDIGGEEYAGVYCTLCGAVILYKTTFDGVQHALGTSGFLYRSNKLMYDKATQSLWSTTLGEPVVGPLAGKGIQLERSFVVTTTWGEWKARHPQTKVLSLDTGYKRDYGEGVAYSDYFATDELMFSVPATDDRLPNKAEILALQFPSVSEERVAVHADFLAKNPLFNHNVGGQKIVILTDGSGANRVYDAGNAEFVSYDGGSKVVDKAGRLWLLQEEALVSQDGAQTAARLPAHRAFWFGWQAVHRDTQLIM